MRLLLSLILLTTLLFSANESFSKSKKQLRKIYQGHQTTIYCDCKYNYKDKKNMIDRKSCGYKPRNERTKKGKVNQRARRIEWEHLKNVLFSFKNMDILNMPILHTLS